MSDLAPRSGGPPSRRSREQRAFRLVTIGGGAAAVAVVGVVLAIVGILGWWLPILAIIVAAICGLLFRRTVG
jgi:putative flippase GtrA